MLYSLVKKLDALFGFPRASAHCDIPCGIYDPIVAQINALTVVRMIDLMHKLESESSKRDVAYDNSMSRYVSVKEHHAEECKREIRVIWGDYIKPPHLEQHPGLHQTVHTIMQLGSKCRQTADRDAGVALVGAVNDFAEAFWATKGVKTRKAQAPYEPKLELVYPVL